MNIEAESYDYVVFFHSDDMGELMEAFDVQATTAYMALAKVKEANPELQGHWEIYPWEIATVYDDFDVVGEVPPMEYN